MSREARRGHPVNRAYERGWQEGWSACLARALETGLAQMLLREEFLPPPQLVTTRDAEGTTAPADANGSTTAGSATEHR